MKGNLSETGRAVTIIVGILLTGGLLAFAVTPEGRTQQSDVKVVGKEEVKAPSNVTKVFLPKANHFVFFHDRQKMKKGHPQARATALNATLPPLPYDWTKNFTLKFPMYDNDQKGDCMWAAAGHAQGQFTGLTGTEVLFSDPAFINKYTQLSGGDNGLDEGTLISGWKTGVTGAPAGSAPQIIVDALDIDPTNAQLVQQAIYYFGGVLFMLDVPDKWINQFSPNGGSVWDAPAVADQNNGHGVWWAGVDAQGRYRLLTWGSYVWITPKGVASCDPSAFMVFSPNWFDPKTGLAPNGLHITQLAAIWQQMGGQSVPASVISQFPPINPVPVPVPPIPPTPVPNPPVPQPTGTGFTGTLIYQNGVLTTVTPGGTNSAQALEAELKAAGVGAPVIADVVQLVTDLKNKAAIQVIMGDLMKIITDTMPTPMPMAPMPMEQSRLDKIEQLLAW